MKHIQYTIRNVPPEVDRALRRRAQKCKCSFNATLVDVLKQVTCVAYDQKVPGDLDWFYGSGGLGEAELAAFERQRIIDKQAWQ